MLRDGCLYQLVREHDAVRRRTLEIMSLPLALRRMRSLVAWETAATSRRARRRRRRGHFVAVRWKVAPGRPASAGRADGDIGALARGERHIVQWPSVHESRCR